MGETYDTHTVIEKPNEHGHNLNYVDQKGCFPWTFKVRAITKLLPWGTDKDKMARKRSWFTIFFFNSSVKKIIQKGIQPREKVVECTDHMPLFLLSDIAYLLHVTNDFGGGAKTFSVINCLVHTIENSFRRLKIR